MIYPKLTEAGKKINADSLLRGKKNYIEFTRVVLGDGEEKTELYGMQRAALSISSIETKKPQQDLVIVRAIYCSSDIVSDFYYRELGLYAMDPETNKEVLYLYGYETSDPEPVRKTDQTALQERAIDLHIKIASAADVVMNINRGFVTFERYKLTIPSQGWEESGIEAYPYFVTIPAPEISARDMAQGTVAIADISIAQECGLANFCESIDKAIKFYADAAPSAPIEYEYLILKGV